MACSERRKELKRRRHRRKKLSTLARKLKQAKTSERQAICETIRALTPGANRILDNWELNDQR